MNGFYAIAIDGPSGAGKSSLAKKISKKYNFVYVDTGAIYRTVGLYAYRNGTDRKDAAAIEKLLPEINIDIKYNETGEQCMYLNGEDVSKEIRLPEISICASDVSALPCVRAFLLEMQRKAATVSNVIMDGRDIGTVVLPNAELKIYLTASAEARADRRMKELHEKGVEQDYNSVLEDIKYRDHQDMTREIAPLKEAEDSVRVDTSLLDFEQSFETLCNVIETKLGIK